MANHKSAEKRARQSIRKTIVNKRIKSAVRTFEKKILTAVTGGNKEEAQKLFQTFSSKMDRAAKKGVYHKNKAARKISRVALKLAQI